MSIKFKSFLNDSIWSIFALVLMNVVAQFVVYPIWSKVYGSEVYGNIVYIMSIVNILAISLGTALNYTRMVDSASRKTHNGDYNRILLVIGTVASIICAIVSFLSIDVMPFGECLLIGTLCFFTTWRYYADVEYRLTVNYKGYFAYYAVISSGYLVGIILFLLTKMWPLALLPGEVAGLAFVWRRGGLFRHSTLNTSANFHMVVKTSTVLIVTHLINNLIFNGDRLLLQNVLGGTAVTIYYLASLIGKTMTLITTPLNSVMIGYLAKYKNKFTVKHIWILLGVSAAAIFVGTIASFVGSHVVVKILYAESYDQVKKFFWLANLAQVIYFITNVLTTFLLRVANANRQLIINIFYAVCFAMFCFAATRQYGMLGFCVSLLVVNILRYFLAVFFCFISVSKR